MKFHGIKKVDRKRSSGLSKIKAVAAAIFKRTVSTKCNKSFNKRNREAIEGTFLTAKGFGFVVSFAGCAVLREFRYGFLQPTTTSFSTDGLQQLKK